MARIMNWLLRQCGWIKFRCLHPSVSMLRPLRCVGTYYAQEGQDVYLSALLFDLIQEKRGRWVVDIGCNHPERFSNSLFFETYFQYPVLAVDPIAEYQDLWQEQRPKATFEAKALGCVEETVVLNIPEGNAIYDDMFSSIASHNPKVNNVAYTQRSVPCVTLASLLEVHQIDDILFVSIDVEGAEMSVLQGIDFNQVRIACFVIENNTKSLFGSEDIRTFLKEKGFVYHARLGYYDDVFLHRRCMK